MNHVTTEMIPTNLIDPPKFNSRLTKNGRLAKEDDAKVEAMAAQFNDAKVGQEQPIDVEAKPDGRFELIFGSRRLRAAHKAGWKQIRAQVHPPAPDSEKMFKNISENMDRENLTMYETARAAAALSDLGLKNPEIGNILHKSPSHVSNLRAAYTGLPVPIRKDWEACHPAAGIDTMAEIARMEGDDEAKTKKWDAITAQAAKRAAAGEGQIGKRGKGKKGTSAGFPISQKRFGHLIAALSSKSGSPDLEDATRKWGKAILDFLVSARESVPSVPKMGAKEGDE